MFCPTCSSEERQTGVYCRMCGTDLRAVRVALERPDDITASAVSARDEIGRAVASKIREMESSKDLKRIAEDVLPQIEKFLESPEEKRLRRVRIGVVSAASGLGATLLVFLLALLTHNEMLIFAGPSVVLFFIGLGLIINGLVFTVPKQRAAPGLPAPDPLLSLDGADDNPGASTGEISPPLTSVTEHTTQHLEERATGVRGRNSSQ